MNEYHANHHLVAAAEERARWAAVLAKPATRATRRPVGMLARMLAIFA